MERLGYDKNIYKTKSFIKLLYNPTPLRGIVD